jgi:streptogramin lyase
MSATVTRRMAAVAVVALATAVASAPVHAAAHETATASAAAGDQAPDGGVFRDLGAPISSLTIMEAVLGRDADGSDVIYAVPAGENANLNVVDVHSRTLKRLVPLPGASGTWAITVASDGSVYIGAYSNGRLYRYRPGDSAATDLGQPIPGENFLYGLTAGDDGVVYGGTFPHAHAFRYDPATGAVTDYGSLDSVQQYARSAVYDPVHKALFVGLQSPKARLFRIDVTTGARQEITPSGFTGASFSDLDYADGRIFGNVDGQLVVFDAATGQQLSYTNAATGALVQRYPLAARGVSPASGGSLYFTTTGAALARYDLSTNTVSRVTRPGGGEVVLTRGVAIGYGWVTDGGHPVLYGLAGNYSAGTYRYDPADGSLEQWSSPFQYVPVPLMHVIADPSDGKVIVSAYLNGNTAIYDPATGQTATAPRLGQVEGWNWAGGKLYAGIYPYGTITEWDPRAPASATNPRQLFSLEASHHQNRPMAVVPSGGKIYVGTTPGYGLYGGAVTVYDMATGRFEVYRDVVTDQSVAALLPVSNVLFGGSAIEGGTGTVPRATEARLFVFDPATGTKTAEYTPVPGAQSVNELTLGPDGNIWGLADGTVFVFDPDDRTVLRRIRVFDGGTGAQDGALVWRDGYLYGVSAGRLFLVDSLAGTATVLRGGSLHRLAPAPDGTLYTLLRPAGQTNRTNLASYRPADDPCPGSDLRATVHVGDVDSAVANRFLSYGCTLADRLPRADAGWRTHGEFVSATAAVVEQLVSASSITPAEGDAIMAAAGRSTADRTG